MSAAIPDNKLSKMLVASTQGYESVVDYGCGDMDYLALLTHIPRRVGVDMFAYWPHQDPDATFLWGDMLLARVNVECAIMIDSIEHLHRDDGLEMIRRLQTYKRAVVFTPLGFFDNHEGEAAHPDNPAQKHLSGWEENDFPGPKWSTSIVPYGGAPKSIYAVWTR